MSCWLRIHEKYDVIAFIEPAVGPRATALLILFEKKVEMSAESSKASMRQQCPHIQGRHAISVTEQLRELLMRAFHALQGLRQPPALVRHAAAGLGRQRAHLAHDHAGLARAARGVLQLRRCLLVGATR